MVDCLEQWEHDAAYRQSKELSTEGHLVYKSRATPIRASTSMSLSTDRTLLAGIDSTPVLVNKSASDVATKVVDGISMHQSAFVHGVAQAVSPEIVSCSYRPDNTVPLVNTGGRAAVGYPPLRVECSSTGFGRQDPSPVVPTPLPSEYYSSGTESDSVIAAVPKLFDPRWSDQAVFQINDTVAMPIRRSYTSPIDTLLGNVQCTGTQPFPGSTTYQVSQNSYAVGRAESTRASVGERAHGYPAESRVGYAQVSAPPQEFCGHPASVHAGYARQVVQAEYVREPTPSIPANGARVPNPIECFMDPVVNRVPLRQWYNHTQVAEQQQPMRNMMKRKDHIGEWCLGVNEPPTFIEDRLPVRPLPTHSNPMDDGAHLQTMENPGTDSREVGERRRRSEDVTHGEQGNNHSHDVTSRSHSAKQGRERTKTNTGKSGSGHRTRIKGRRDSSPDSSSSSSRSRSRSGG